MARSAGSGAQRYRVAGAFLVLWCAVLVIMTIFGVVLVVSSISGSVRSGPPPFLMVVWFGVLGWLWYVPLRFISYEVTILPDGRVQFRSVLRTWSVPGSRIRTVAPMFGGLDPYTVSVRTDAGNARILRMMDGFSEMIARFRELNPDLRTRGV